MLRYAKVSRYLFWIMVLFLLDLYLEMGLLDHRIVLFLNFLRTLHAVFYSSCADSHSHQQCTSVPFSVHSCQHMLSLHFLMIHILTGGRQYLIVVLICICLMINDFDYLCLYLAIYVSFLEKSIYSGLLSIFKLGCFFGY